MQPTQTLPAHYRLFKRLSIRDNAPLVMLNILSLGLLAIAGYLLFQLVRWLRPAALGEVFTITIRSTGNFLIILVAVVAATAVMMVAHEALHGIFFWLYTRARPKFGFRGAYAFAAAPDWYLPRDPYFITSLAPLVGITLLGILLLAFAPVSWIPWVLLIVTFNAAGAVGDLWVAWWLWRCPPDALGNDQGDVTSLYVPGEG
jgi:hypothetical protein